MLALRNPQDVSDPVGPHWIEETAFDWTALGGVPVLSLVVLLVVTYLLIARRIRIASFVLISTASGVGLSFFLKTLYDRVRPDFLEHLASTSTSSFPSSHAMASSVVYLTLGSLLARASRRRRAKIYFIAASLFLTLAIGATRVFLGVHYPTDVLAGWAFGMAWALGCLFVLIHLQRRGLLRRDQGVLMFKDTAEARFPTNGSQGMS